MYHLEFILLLTCLTCVLCQFSLLSVPKSNREFGRPPKINSPNSIWRIQVGPKVTVTNEAISNQSQVQSTPVSPQLVKRSTVASFDYSNEQPNRVSNLNNIESASPNTLNVSSLEVVNTSTHANRLNETVSFVKVNQSNDLKKSDDSNRPKSESGRTARFGGLSFADLKPKFPTPNDVQSLGDRLKPNVPSFGGAMKPNLPADVPTASDFGKFANKFKDLPIVSEFLNIPNYFKINNLKGALDYMMKYGHLEDAIDIEKPQDVLNLKDAFKRFQEFFGISKSGLFDQETLNLMNQPRCGLPDKETKLTRLVGSLNGAFGLTRQKRFALYNVKYESTRNLTWSIIEFSKKALQNQDEQVVNVMREAFEVWSNATNLSFQYKPNANDSDILIGFYSKQHGNPHVEPPFDGPNGTLAHTSYPTESDMHLDDDENWSFYPSNNLTDLFTVSIHEIGHKLGLKHTKVQTACLFPIYNPQSTHLDEDDLQGIQSLYGVKHNEEDKEKEIVDLNAIEESEEDRDPTDKPDEDIPIDDNEGKPTDSRPDNWPNRPEIKPENRPDDGAPTEDRPIDDNEGKPTDNRPDNRPNRPDNIPENIPGNRPDDGGPTEDKPIENKPTEDRPDDTWAEDGDQPIPILSFNPKRNIYGKRKFLELISTPCKDLNIDSSVCLPNNKCLVIAGDSHFWMNGKLKMIQRKRERNDFMFRGLNQGRIDSIYRDKNLIHIIQGKNVTTYDSFYAEPINRTTIQQHFGLPRHVSRVSSVFKKLSTGVIYVYSGEFYWRFTKAYGLEPFPRLVFIFGLPSNIKSVLHFNNGRSVYIKNANYWLFDEVSNRLLSYLPGNLSDLRICRNEGSSSIFERLRG